MGKGRGQKSGHVWGALPMRVENKSGRGKESV